MALPKAFSEPAETIRPDDHAGIRVARVCESAWIIVQSRADRKELLTSRPDHPASWQRVVQKFKR